MARMTDDQLAEFLERPLAGVLATTRRNGQPYSVPVSWAWIEGAFWISGTADRVWCRHLTERPEVNICIQTLEPYAAYVSADCDAAIHTEDSYPDLWARTAIVIGRYMAAGVTAEGAVDVDQYIDRVRATESRILIELRPQPRPKAIRAHDLSVYTSSHRDRRSD